MYWWARARDCDRKWVVIAGNFVSAVGAIIRAACVYEALRRRGIARIRVRARTSVGADRGGIGR